MKDYILGILVGGLMVWLFLPEFQKSMKLAALRQQEQIRKIVRQEMENKNA